MTVRALAEKGYSSTVLTAVDLSVTRVVAHDTADIRSVAKRSSFNATVVVASVTCLCVIVSIVADDQRALSKTDDTAHVLSAVIPSILVGLGRTRIAFFNVSRGVIKLCIVIASLKERRSVGLSNYTANRARASCTVVLDNDSVYFICIAVYTVDSLEAITCRSNDTTCVYACLYVTVVVKIFKSYVISRNSYETARVTRGAGYVSVVLSALNASCRVELTRDTTRSISANAVNSAVVYTIGSLTALKSAYDTANVISAVDCIDDTLSGITLNAVYAVLKLHLSRALGPAYHTTAYEVGGYSSLVAASADIGSNLGVSKDTACASAGGAGSYSARVCTLRNGDRRITRTENTACGIVTLVVCSVLYNSSVSSNSSCIFTIGDHHCALEFTANTTYVVSSNIALVIASADFKNKSILRPVSTDDTACYPKSNGGLGNSDITVVCAIGDSGSGIFLSAGIAHNTSNTVVRAVISLVEDNDITVVLTAVDLGSASVVVS